MPIHQNPFLRDGMLLRRTGLFAVALLAGFVMVPLVAPGAHDASEFVEPAALALVTAATVMFFPWRRLPSWVQVVPPLLYMVVVAKLYAIGGGPTSGFGALILLPVLWLALYGTQSQMIASIVAAGLLVVGPNLLLGGVVSTEAEYRRGFVVTIVAAVMGFTVQRLVGKVRARADQESERAETFEEATNQFDRAFETAPIGMAITTVAGRFMRVNPSLCAMVGRAREDLVGRKLEEITHPEDRTRDFEAIPKLLRGEISTYQSETRYLHMDGQVVWVLFSLTLVRDSQGDPRHLFVQMQDVTARRLAEQRVSEAEERYRTMVEQLPLVTYIDALDDFSSAVYMSPQVEPLLGYAVEEWLEDPAMFTKLLHPDDRERVMERVQQCNADGSPFVEEYRLIARDGSVVWIRDEAHHVIGSDGHMRQMQGLMMDITEAKAAESRLLLQRSVASTIAGAESLREATPGLLRSLCEAMEWDVAVLWQVDARRDTLRCVDLWNDRDLDLGEFERATREWAFKLGEGLPGRVWGSGEHHWTPNFGSDTEFPRGPLFGRTGLNSAGAFPVRAGGRQLGVIEFFSRAVRQPDQKVTSQMAAISALLGQFIERLQAEDRLREAEERYRRLVERLPTVTYIASFGEAGKWLYVSPQIESTLGFTPSEWTTDSTLWFRQLVPEDRERVMEAERRSREHGETFVTEYRVLARDGGVHWFRDEAMVIEDESGRPTRLSGMMTDITEQKLTEQALRDSEKRFRALGTQAPVGIFETDAQWNCTFVNDRWCEIAGVTRDRAITDGWIEAVHADDYDQVAADWLEATSNGDPFDAECRVRTPAGRISFVSTSAVALRDETGSITGYIGTMTDVTERKRIERLEAIQTAVSKAMADSTDHEDAIRRMTEALARSMGWKLGVFWECHHDKVATESIGRPVSVLRCAQTWSESDLRAEQFVERCRQMTFSSPLGMLGRVWEGGRGEWSSSLGEARSQRAQLAVSLGMDGAVCMPVYGDTQLLGVLEFFGVEIEDPGDAFLDVHTGLGRQIGEYIERKRAEGEADRAKDEFFALVSHELRTPLTSIIGYLELMQEEEAGIDPAEQRHFLDIVQRNADRLLRLVGDLLLVAQVQAGKFALRPGPVDMGAIAAHAVEAAEPLARGRTIQLVLKREPVPVFAGDRDRVAQLFDNLISNALKFTNPGERVTVRVGMRGEQANVEVHNSGSTIPEEERSRLFDRFFRASDATTRVAPGVGLGLAIVKAIVEAHGGSIRVDSNEMGTTFRFTLPVEVASELEAAAKQAA